LSIFDASIGGPVTNEDDIRTARLPATLWLAKRTTGDELLSKLNLAKLEAAVIMPPIPERPIILIDGRVADRTKRSNSTMTDERETSTARILHPNFKVGEKARLVSRCSKRKASPSTQSASMLTESVQSFRRGTSHVCSGNNDGNYDVCNVECSGEEAHHSGTFQRRDITLDSNLHDGLDVNEIILLCTSTTKIISCLLCAVGLISRLFVRVGGCAPLKIGSKIEPTGRSVAKRAGIMITNSSEKGGGGTRDVSISAAASTDKPLGPKMSTISDGIVSPSGAVSEEYDTSPSLFLIQCPVDAVVVSKLGYIEIRESSSAVVSRCSRTSPKRSVGMILKHVGSIMRGCATLARLLILICILGSLNVQADHINSQDEVAPPAVGELGAERGWEGSEGGFVVRGRILEEFTITDMNELYNSFSNGEYGHENHYGIVPGNSPMNHGDTAVVVAGTYKCSQGTCARSEGRVDDADEGNMLYTDLSGELRCVEDTSSCILDGEHQRILQVLGEGTNQILTIRALSFLNGISSWGGGIYVNGNALVDIKLCVFSNCGATTDYGGGAIYIYTSGTNVNVYGTRFNDNTAVSNGKDIQNDGGSFTIHDTCPSPYEDITPIQGKCRVALLFLQPTSHLPSNSSHQGLLWMLAAVSLALLSHTLGALL
jgi:hypothetical protein